MVDGDKKVSVRRSKLGKLTGANERKLATPLDPTLVKAVIRLFDDGLVLLGHDIRRDTMAGKRRALRERLHITEENFSRWQNRSIKIDSRRKGKRGFVRYPAQEVTNQLIALLEGKDYIHDKDKTNRKIDRDFALRLLQHWKRDKPPESVDDILKLLKVYRDRVDEEVAHLTDEAKDESRRDLANAAAAVGGVDTDHRLHFWGQDRAALIRLDARFDVGAMPVVVEQVGAAHRADREKAPPIIRLSVTPYGIPSPRPVNMLMVVGGSRRAAIAVTLGLDAQELAESLTAVESMLGRIEDQQYVTRTWDIGPPRSRGTDGARGAVWEVAGRTSAEDIWRALATAFGRRQDGCGNVVVMVLPFGAQQRAHSFVEILMKAGAAGGPLVGIPVPTYLWRSGAPDAGAAEPLLGRIRSCVEAGVCADHSADVQAVFRMRLHAGATLAPDWDRADGEQVRLHDLSVASSNNASQPTSLDEMRATDLILRVHRNPNLLYSLSYLPVSQKILTALTSAPALTRAVVGLLTPEELQARRPSWSRPMADGYRPAPALMLPLPG